MKLKLFKKKKVFSDPKLQFEDIRKCFGLKTNLIENVGEMPCSIFLPDGYDFDVSDTLIQNLKNLDRNCPKDNEFSRRNYIQCILLEVLGVIKSNMQLKSEVWRKYEEPNLILTGKADFLVDSSTKTVYGIKIDDQVSFDDFIVLVETKQRLGGSSYEAQICQLLACVGASIKLRQVTKKSTEYPNTPVFGVLTDAVTFQFFVIDDDLQVYSSGDHTNLRLNANSDYKKSEDLSKILSWTKFIIESSMSVSPRCSKVDLSPESAEKTLRSLRSCFKKT